MQTGMVNTARLASSAFSVVSRNGGPDFDLAAALQ
jgi:flagellar protein FlgJ